MGRFSPSRAAQNNVKRAEFCGSSGAQSHASQIVANLADATPPEGEGGEAAAVAAERRAAIRLANVLGRLRSGRRSARLAQRVAGSGRRVAHGLDVMALGILMELVARATERRLASAVERDVAPGDDSSSAEPEPR